MNNFSEAFDWLLSHRNYGIKPGLERIEAVLEHLGHPERVFNSIHIGGTNGKGSTVTYVRQIMQQAGYNVGTFTSPYVVQFEERISINGTPISEEEFTVAAISVREALERVNHPYGPATEFEILTLIAMVHFANVKELDLVIFEVGLGGRLDSTNIIHPLVSAITNVGQDHMHILGNTIEDIAFEKAGIIKQNVPIVTTVVNEEALRVIRRIAQEKKAPITIVHDELNVHIAKLDEEGSTFSVITKQSTYSELTIRMRGAHQVDNALLAIRIVEELTSFNYLVNEDEVRKGLELAFWPGRLELVRSNPRVLLDGAHNPEGIERLSSYLQTIVQGRKLHLIIAMTIEKDIQQMLEPLIVLQPASVTFTSFNHVRAMDPEVIIEQVPFDARAEMNNHKAVQEMLREADDQDVIVVVGSLFLISEVRAFF
ncbi:folylpolyglutamate synthase/dihydrofolate synthase family protein [Geomicrobium sp. JCM 19038]|uniref:bifunctional folylpolyglutamate synthase/dihydrofolate synthase n=1 Tax=Geomicrobium sp. JCM 19038 TaxID=1460635 RepID=UPI00045F32B8|nr:folylpolyglutamate synthase/dihydrofolate synthase family protein [Geomicrobium sp. JCM 19038]GAK09275.1 dihydrofolate synthase [Geomicrobium sp. JCM 19038]